MKVDIKKVKSQRRQAMNKIFKNVILKYELDSYESELFIQDIIEEGRKNPFGRSSSLDVKRCEHLIRNSVFESFSELGRQIEYYFTDEFVNAVFLTLRSLVFYDYVFENYSFSEDELLDLAKNSNYWKFNNEGSCLFAFLPERLEELISTGFLIREPGHQSSYLIAEIWRYEFRRFLETSNPPKEVADTIRRGY